jgi:hypothetical protein
MNPEKINIVISPEVLRDDLFEEIYQTQTFDVYSGLSYVLSGGTGGTSLLTGLTIPILLTSNYNDIGYYSPFEGFIDQKDIVTNFVISGDPINTYQVHIYNSAGYNFQNYLQVSSYYISWGDGSTSSTLSINNPIQSHIYPSAPQNYTITLTQSNIFGITTIQQPVTLPFTGVTVTNELGNITFAPQGGSWSGVQLSLDYIFTGDSNNNLNQQISSAFTTVPFQVSGYTNSQLELLRRWGPQPFTVGYITQLSNGNIGYVSEITNEYTAYTINNINYYNLPNGLTYFIFDSSGFTSNDLVVSALTKNEYLLDFVMDPEVQSDVAIERGQYSPFEPLQRLNEVDNLGDLVSYGYGYYKINNA